MNFWTFFGIGFLLWLLIELLTGRVWLHREIKNESESTYYWVIILFWAMLGVSCFIRAYASIFGV